MKEKIVQTFRDNSGVSDECARINTQRVYYLALISIPVRIISILLFFTKSNETPVLRTWSRGIIASHVILLIFIVGFFISARKLKRKPQLSTAMRVLQYMVVAVIMSSGIAIVTFDQLVTTNITPFVITSVVCGAVFLIRPLVSCLIFLASYGAYYFYVALTITDQNILLSNRVNGITAVAIGFLLSFILWRYNYTNIVQKRRIESQQKQLEHLAYYDPLTGLPNRRLLNQLIKREFASMERHGHETVLIILDIDDFKKINDTHGHLAGDRILRQLAYLLKDNVRELDTVARFGGEEFVILMPQTTVEEGYATAERLRKRIMEERFAAESETMQITSSFGVSSLREVDSKILEDSFLLADKALYLAKQSGKNRVEKANEKASAPL
ncbi:MAG TPA: GGDEF domain-containing protein [Papillibacter sp.]|nr:GGDEF domain-containing protein [Papillibacter sp.]